MYIQYHILIFISIALVRGEEQASTDGNHKNNKSTDGGDHKEKHADEFLRRFMDKLNDEEWHIAHLKPTDLQSVRRASGCREDSVPEKIKKYRKSLKDDAGRLEFVSSDPLPVDESEIREYACKAEDELDKKIYTNTERKIKVLEGGDEENATVNVTSKVRAVKENVSLSDARSLNGTARVEDSTAENDEEAVVTTDDTPRQLTKAPDDKKKHRARKHKVKDDKDTVRRSDYLFESGEDEADVAEFDDHECPNVVDIIVLEQDIIRSYDVECELSIEWSSLE